MKPWHLLASLLLLSHLQAATEVAIQGDEFRINGKPTYEGRFWQGQKIQGLLFNSRMVQGVFDDLNPETRKRWAYPDTGQFDADRNTREFLAAMPSWKQAGLLAFTINFQGGSPEGYSREQPWHNSAFESDGSLRPDYLKRMKLILDEADRLGMVVILGYFYFGQDERLKDEAAVLNAVDRATAWVQSNGWRNLLIEINNECNVRYDHAILRPERVHELIQRVQKTAPGGRSLPVGTSYGGGTIPGENVVRSSDFLLIHGNGVSDPARITAMVEKTRAVPGYRPMPILFNEDDHFDFDRPTNNLLSATRAYASWGYFDPGKNNYQEGYQSPPVQWGLNTERKRGFFNLVAQITSGAAPAPARIGSMATNPPAMTVVRTNYLQWNDAFLIGNGLVEALVVPVVGRVMQFRFAGQTNGPFWHNPALVGQQPKPASSEWGNFGGDKTWPAPQGDWPKIIERGWPPPTAFDAMPLDAILSSRGIALVSPIDRHFGIRTIREVELLPNQPVMRIVTTYQQVSERTNQVGVWIITQLQEADAVFMPVQSQPYVVSSEQPPPSVQTNAQWIWLTRNPKASHKIGNRASSLVWVGRQEALRIDSPRIPNRPYPHQESSAEIYTNPDPLPYIELETLGPLTELKPGDRISQTNFYTLFPRREKEPLAEASRVLSAPPVHF